VAGQRLVDGVVDDLVDHVMQAGTVIGVADIHARPLARTASRPFKTRIDSAPYSIGMECSVSAIDCRAGSVM